MRVAVIQPSYIPWLGFFYMMDRVDLFIYYDQVQYDKHGWRNRNRVDCKGIPKWLTLSINNRNLPCRLEERLLYLVELYNNDQFARHSQILKQYYSKAEQYQTVDELYPSVLGSSLSLCDSIIIQNDLIACMLDIKTPCVRSRSLEYNRMPRSSSSLNAKNENLLSLLLAVGATEYVSGISAKAYIDETLFRNQGIRIIWNEFVNPSETVYSTIHYIITEGANQVVRYLR